MILIDLFFSFLQIGLFSIGGGYAAMPIIQYQVVDVHQWLSVQHFADVVTISEMTPGPIAINSATFVGMRVAGFPGALVATLGVVLPAFIILSFLSYIYFKYHNLDLIQGVLFGLRPAVVSMILSAGLVILLGSIFQARMIHFNFSQIDFTSMILFGLSLIALIKLKWSPIVTMLVCGIIGVVLYTII